MNGKRCAILVTEATNQDECDGYASKLPVKLTMLTDYIRIFGSHSEAKRELTKWLPEWPDARIVDEEEL
jgi:hypothetical protein